MEKYPVRRKIVGWLGVPFRSLSAAHPRYLTRLYITGSALFLLAIGISTAQALTDETGSGRSKPQGVVQPNDKAAESLSPVSTPEISQETGVIMNRSGQTSSSSSQTDISVQSDQSSASVTVNGDTTTVPKDGSLNRSYQADDGRTRIDVSIDSSSTSSETPGRHDRFRMNVRSSSSSESTKDINL